MPVARGGDESQNRRKRFVYATWSSATLVTSARSPVRVSLLAIPDAMASSLSGLYEVLSGFDLFATMGGPAAGPAPFQVEVVSPVATPTTTASGLTLTPDRTLAQVAGTDIVILPSMLVADGEWRPGRYPEVVCWLKAMNEGGATLCSACSGVLLLAETGLLDGHEATVHWAYARTFRRNFPRVRLSVEKVLVITGNRGQFVMSGASASWHDLVLYLIARRAGPSTAQMIAKFMLLQWHEDGQAPYAVFNAPTDHGDAVILSAQEWLGDHFTVASPVEEMVKRSGLPERSFKRRFSKATGLTPIGYVQQLRIESAKRRLEASDDPIDEISWGVGYEDPAFFRRLFKRITRITPGDYRRKFKMPEFAAPVSE